VLDEFDDVVMVQFCENVDFFKDLFFDMFWQVGFVDFFVAKFLAGNFVFDYVGSSGCTPEM
jgi:hypothetical protein